MNEEYPHGWGDWIIPKQELQTDPVGEYDAATKQYVDASTASAAAFVDTHEEAVTDGGSGPTVFTRAGVRALFAWWTGFSDISGHGYFQVQLSLNSGFSSILDDISTRTTWTTFDGLGTGLTYYVRVRAIDAAGNVSAWSASTGSSENAPEFVETGDIADDAVTEVKIVDTAITESKLADLAVTLAKIANNSISTVKLVDLSVVEGKLAAASVVTSKLADGAVTSDKIPALNITNTHIADNSISTPKLQANSVTANEIAAATITADEIAANTITAGQIAANTITATEIVANTITAAEIAALTITAGQIAANTITSSEIQANTITSAEIAANTITAAEIAALTISADEIAANAITAGKINALAVETDKLAANAVTAAKLSAMNIGVGKYIRSTVYTAGSAGWSIDAAGNAEFNNVTVRGTVTSSTITGTTITGGTIRTAASGARVELSDDDVDRIHWYPAVTNGVFDRALAAVLTTGTLPYRRHALQVNGPGWGNGNGKALLYLDGYENNGSPYSKMRVDLAGTSASRIEFTGPSGSIFQSFMPVEVTGTLDVTGQTYITHNGSPTSPSLIVNTTHASGGIASFRKNGLDQAYFTNTGALFQNSDANSTALPYKVCYFYGTLDGSGNASITMGGSGAFYEAHKRVLCCNAWYRGGSGEMEAMNIDYIDGGTLRIVGGIASRKFRVGVVIMVTSDANW